MKRSKETLKIQNRYYGIAAKEMHEALMKQEFTCIQCEMDNKSPQIHPLSNFGDYIFMFRMGGFMCKECYKKHVEVVPVSRVEVGKLSLTKPKK